MAKHTPHLLFTCEHASAFVPPALRPLLINHKHRGTHRELDLGALPVARTLAQRFAAPLFEGKISRLLVDMNRSPSNPRVFSPLVQNLPVAQQQNLLEKYHTPHWQAVGDHVAQAIARYGQVVHIAVHSFTPVLVHEDGRQDTRTADIGLLYDPARAGEATMASRWVASLKEAEPTLAVRRNYPYLGKGDGLASSLRKRHAPGRYIGFELEVNQARLVPKVQPRVMAALVASVAAMGFRLNRARVSVYVSRAP
ncbi:MAG: N-formylglutamate amidohydrolase [Deltaproteobacteria bacterium]|nr:N-formylglutamate amidohydrolase [Deltaproteobacteria bacterium]